MDCKCILLSIYTWIVCALAFILSIVYDIYPQIICSTVAAAAIVFQVIIVKSCNDPYAAVKWHKRGMRFVYDISKRIHLTGFGLSFIYSKMDIPAKVLAIVLLFLADLVAADSLSSGDIAGIVLGPLCLVLLIILIVLAVLYSKKTEEAKKNYEEITNLKSRIRDNQGNNSV
ncbi:hypothetical protein BgiBS90_025805 [Biomphalaria glabrata]|nr:hypothetical protein BgiBS90_025805 [Biomphalaria glabrata]